MKSSEGLADLYAVKPEFKEGLADVRAVKPKTPIKEPLPRSFIYLTSRFTSVHPLYRHFTPAADDRLFFERAQDAGIYTAARKTLDEGQAYISMPTQRKVMEKVRVFHTSTKAEEPYVNVGCTRVITICASARIVNVFYCVYWIGCLSRVR